jgi:hypothetical protein
MNRKGPIMMAAALLLGGGVTPALSGVSVRSAAAADEPQASVHPSAGGGAGLVTAVDADTNTLVLETRTGAQRVHVARAATIRDDHADALGGAGAGG